MKKILLLFSILVLSLPVLSFAQDQFGEYISGEVTAIIDTTYPIVFGQEIEFQTLQVKLDDGSVVDTVFNDYTPVGPGARVYLSEGYDPDTDQEGYFVREIDRVPALLLMLGIFLIAYITLTGFTGLRSLIALGLSILLIFFVLIPSVAAGNSVIASSFIISAIILGCAIFITHKFSVLSFVSYVGSLLAIIAAFLFALFITKIASISGLVGDEAATLIVLYGASINVGDLVLASMVIGILGLLDDVSVVQAGIVRELIRTKSLSTQEVFIRALRVGKEHAASLVNTLVLAYVSVSLPLLLILSAPANTSIPTPFRMDISNELLAVELIRSITGSFGLVLAIPLVTLIAILVYKRFPPQGEYHGHVHMH